MRIEDDSLLMIDILDNCKTAVREFETGLMFFPPHILYDCVRVCELYMSDAIL